MPADSELGKFKGSFGKRAGVKFGEKDGGRWQLSQDEDKEKLIEEGLYNKCPGLYNKFSHSSMLSSGNPAHVFRHRIEQVPHIGNLY